MERKKYPIRAEDYQLLEVVGEGGSASVHRARCVPLGEIVAVKILDFESKNSDLNSISREAQTMILIDHPNVLNAHCSFVNDHTLWVVMPYMAGGSCLHIMKSAYPNGFEEAVIVFLLREVLKGLEYLHQQGHIHRDVKAGNVLIDARHGVKLGDFGVSACLFDSGDRQWTRNTFVGTPCWMAPEVMEQLHGYDFKADIWSFGITALELAHGHAPFSSQPPMKVLLMTLQHAPPSLDYKRGKKFSRSFGHMIATCLVKDPSKRPSARKLLKHHFFKQAKYHDSAARKILEGLPSLGDRFHALKLKEADLLAQKKMLGGEKEEMSQNEYKRGISTWNFYIGDLKAQASQISDEDILQGKDQEGCSNSLFEIDTLHESMPQGMSSASTSCSLKDDADGNKADILSSPNQTATLGRVKSDVSENEYMVAGANDQHVLQNGLQTHGNDLENNVTVSSESENDEKHTDNILTHYCHVHKASTSSCSSDILQSSRGESARQQDQIEIMENCNDGMCHAITASTVNDLDEKSKAPVVQQRGRFKVTSENVDLDKAIVQLPISSLAASPEATSNLRGGSLFEQLQYILQTNIVQRDCIIHIMKQVTTSDSSVNQASEGVFIPTCSNVKLLSEREKQQLSQDIDDLQSRLICTQEELQMLKTKIAQV